MTDNDFVDRPFSEITDKDILLDENDDKIFIRMLYTKDGEVRKNAWQHLSYLIDCKRAFTSFNLYNLIKSEVKFEGDKMVLKDGGKIIAEMY